MPNPIRPSDPSHIPEHLLKKTEPTPNRAVLTIEDKSYEVVVLKLETNDKVRGSTVTSKPHVTEDLAKKIEGIVLNLIRDKKLDPNKDAKIRIGDYLIIYKTTASGTKRPTLKNRTNIIMKILEGLGRIIGKALGIQRNTTPIISSQDSRTSPTRPPQRDLQGQQAQPASPPRQQAQSAGNREAQRQIIQNVIKNPSELKKPETRAFILTQLLEFHEQKGCPSQKISERLVLLHAAIKAAGGIGEDTQEALLQLSKDCPNSKNVFGSSPTINGDPLKALQHEIHEVYKKANPGSRNISADFGKYALTEGLSNPDLSGIYQGYIMKALNVLINKANTESSRIDAAINHAVERPSDNSNQEIAAICADLLKTPTDSRQQLPAQTSRAEVPPSGMITSGPAAPSISSQDQTPLPQTATRAAIHSVKPAAPAQQRTKITSDELRANVYTIASTNLQVDTKEARIMNRIIQYLTNAFLDKDQMPDNIKAILKLNITATSPITTLEKASLVTYYADLIDLIDNGRPEAPTSQSPSRTSSRGTTSRPTSPSGVVTKAPAEITSSTRPAPSISPQHQTPPPQTATRAPTQIVKPAAPATPLATGEIRRSDPPGSLIIQSPPDGDCAAHSIVNQLQQRNILKADGSKFTNQSEIRSLASTELERIAETLANASGDTPDRALADQIIISIKEAYEKINTQPQSLRATLQSIRKLIEKYKDPKGQLSSA